MRIHVVSAMIVAIAALSSTALAQDDPWKPCPRCQTDRQREIATKDVQNHPFNPHDLTGIWGRNGIALSNQIPPMTAWGQAKFDAAKPAWVRALFLSATIP